MPWQRAAIAAALALAVFAAFAPSLGNNFTGYDDPAYVTENPHVTTGITRANVVWAFTAVQSNNWHPLTWISHALDCTRYGLNPAGHHLTSLLFHVLNTVLLFLWLNDVTGARLRSALVAALFGLHPTHVESVAWVAERKDVLSTFFLLLTLISYTAYVRRPSLARYGLAAVALALGLLSKQMLVTVPILLLVLDRWPLVLVAVPRRFRVLEKIPLLALSVAAAGAAVWAQRQSGAMSTLEQLPLGLRLANAVVSYVRYLGKIFYPVDLAAFYPFHLAIPPATVVAAGAFLLVISAAVFVLRDRRPWLLTGWCSYLITLLPVIGIVQVGMQSMADRYLYIPLVGIAIAIVWEFPDAPLLRPYAITVATAVLATLAILTWRQTHVWKDGLTLFTHAVAVTRDNFVAHDNLGVELDRRGRYEEALAQYRETIRIKPGDRNGEQNYAMATFSKAQRLFAENKHAAAIPVFQEGLRYRPANPQALVSLGVAYANTGKAEEARSAFEQAVRWNPASVEARYDLGLVQATLGHRAAAVQSFQAILRIDPAYAPAKDALTQLGAVWH